MRILVADDQPGVLEAARFLLKTEGHTAVTADSPQAVLQLTSSQIFDLILIDLNYARDTTSGQEGLDLLAALKAAGVPSPVVVMTAWGSVDLAVEAMRRGASDFVQKPWENARLLETIERQIARARASKSDLDIAREVQAKLLPRSGPEVAGFEYAGRCVPVRGIGGDSFDWFDVGGGRMGFVLADVSGKGIGAALLMANLHGALRTALSMGFHDGPDLLRVVNRQFFESSSPEHYASAFFAVYQAESRRLTWVNAGHVPALVLRADGQTDWLAPTGTPLGMFGQWSASGASTQLGSGDTVLVYSDGVVEAGLAGRGEEFGEARLAECVRAASGMSAADLVNCVCGHIAGWDSVQHDDYTVLALRCTT
jgi:sigma-B regulation protein RsbU (phosphoserine phosphatase)